jgi:phytoene dehydrogenase-like protein
MLERADRIGGAAVSERPFPGVNALLSRYSYLVSLFPSELRRQLGLDVELRPRLGLEADSPELLIWHERMQQLAQRVAPTLLRPLLSREEFRELVDDDQLWNDVFTTPLGTALEREISSGEERGVVLTDALIGTFSAADDPALRQNRCFLYHVVGDGIGRWDVPVGGMGHVTDQLARLAGQAGAEIRTAAEVTALDADGSSAEVTCADGARLRCRHVLWAAAPHWLEELVSPGAEPRRRPEGSQLKVNMVLDRLPRLRGSRASAEQAFTGTFHINESYAQLQTAYAEAGVGFIPTVAPCDVYCHSLTDPSILGDELRARGAHTLTVFGLHMPARLFGADHDTAKRAAVASVLASINSVLEEPIEECLLRDAEGEPCLEALTPVEIETELGMPGGHIFHRDLSWPFAETDAEVGRWGVETEIPNVWLAGAGARRGGGVSGIPGHNAAQAVLAARAGR